jgi:hypothetical protein
MWDGNSPDRASIQQVTGSPQFLAGGSSGSGVQFSHKLLIRYLSKAFLQFLQVLFILILYKDKNFNLFLFLQKKR